MRQIAIFLIVIAAVGFFIYSPALKGPFVWDDEHLILHNSYLRSWHHLPQLLSQDIAAGSGRRFGFWRPLQMLSYFIDYSIGKQDPFGYHFVNILLHVLGAFALFWFLQVISGDRALSGIAALLFVSHPIHTEAVNYISGRADLLAFLFLMLAFVFYIKENRWMAACYAVALLSRESALILPVLIGAYHFMLKKPLNRHRFLAIGGLALTYLILRMIFLRSLWTEEPLSKIGWAQRWPGALAALSEYVRLLILPLDLHMGYGNILFKPTDIRVIFGAVILGMLFFLLLRRKTSALIRFSVSWFLLALAPFLNIIVPLNAFMAEHWLYLSSVGFFILAAYGIKRLGKKTSALALGLLVALVGFYGTLTDYNSRFWANPMKLFEHIVKLAPTNNDALINLALVYKDLGRFGEAKDLLERALEQKPSDYLVYNVLGSVYYQIGDKQNAQTVWQNGLSIESRFCEFYNNLGVIEAGKGNFQKAVSLFHDSIRRNPFYADAYKNLAVAYYNTSEYDEALNYWDRARQLGLREDPVVADAFEQLRKKLESGLSPNKPL